MSVVDGRYIVGRELGEGAYASVCKGFDIQNGRRPVAVKTLDLTWVPPGETRSSWSVETVKREVDMMRKLDHPKCVTRDCKQLP